MFDDLNDKTPSEALKLVREKRKDVKCLKYFYLLNKLEEVFMNKIFRSETPELIWLWGKTGTGKSAYAYKDYDDENTYIWDRNSKWNYYKQEDVVIIDNFASGISCENFIDLVDWCPHYVNRSRKSPISFTSKKIIVASLYPPYELFKSKKSNDSVERLMKKIKVINTDNENSIIEK